MGGIVRSCVQSMLKLVNSIMAMFGIAMILYALWMLRAWNKELGPSPFLPTQPSQLPWFIYTFLGLGITLCVITCSGHIAAETANGICLYFYMLFVFLLIMLEAAVTADVFLNHSWEEDFPADPSGRFDAFKDFVRSNFEICKWIGLSLVSVQGLCMLLALVLKALGPQQSSDDSDDEYASARVPLLKNSVHQPPYAIGDPVYGSKNDSWNLRINDKVTQEGTVGNQYLAEGDSGRIIVEHK